ncbi:MAG: anti sigma factor C-terminal domain-containing protein [Faecousia sp.]
MNFKNAIEHYRAGTATNDERAWVEEELEKYQLLSDLMDTQWEQTPAESAVEPQKEEMKKLHGKLRKRNALLVLTSLLLVISILVVALAVASPVLAKQQKEQISDGIAQNEQEQAILEAQYWNPNQRTYDDFSTDLELALFAYTELFQPGYRVEGLTVTHTGFATYSLTIKRWDCAKGEAACHNATLELGNLSLPSDYHSTLPINYMAYGAYPYYPLDANAVQLYREKLEALPEYIQVRAAVSFPEDISMEELIRFYDTSNVYVAWSGIRVSEQNRQMVPLCGMDAFSGGQISSERLNEAYPMFCIAGSSCTPENLSQHIISLLRYSADQQAAGTGIPVSSNDSYYQDALSYVGENGVKSYGCVVVGTPQALLALLDSGVACQIIPMEAWVGV